MSRCIIISPLLSLRTCNVCVVSSQYNLRLLSFFACVNKKSEYEKAPSAQIDFTYTTARATVDLSSFQFLNHLDKFLAVGRKSHFAGCFVFISVPDLLCEMRGKVCALKVNAVDGEYRVAEKAKVCFAKSW